jgi:glycosyltransferase involved in cell wall biosynthesis
MNGSPGVAESAALALSALVITKNEGENVERCLSSLRFCSEIVVLDAESTDGTAEAARRFTPRVYVEPWRGYAAQKQRALDLCRGAWVLWIDADEAVSPELAAAVRGVVEGAAKEAGRDGARAGYYLRRRVFYLGRWVSHGGWGDDQVLRLFRRDAGRFSEDQVHERVVLTGSAGRLPGFLEHYSYRDLSHHWSKISELSRLWAQQARARGRRARAADLLFRPIARFLRIYLWRLGLLDGWRGLVIAGMAAAYVFLKYARLLEEEHR